VALLSVLSRSRYTMFISIAADIATLGTRNTERTPLEWSLYGAGFLVAIGIVIYLSRLASRTLARYTREDTKGEE